MLHAHSFNQNPKDDGETHIDVFRYMGGPCHFKYGEDDTVAAARTLIGRVTRDISRVLGYMHGPAVFQTRIPSIARPSLH